ncbi:tail assembly protein [Vibrio phage vB_ValS_R12Z]|uniref:Putative tail assembly protein n=3 Tax=Mardecavirus SSP002 TaxID=1921699 RepID=A0A384X9M5_9CAUD|nr:tail assembly protein [Vibrio phage SSP002]ATI19449.1 putative tail assembly protein [Vibrio phage vB_VpaS_KF6]QEP53414.1 putative tail assembly protein [Vibrio phage vB_VpaS_HCMJ]UTQ72778.1 putative tail assembly protein [Vibrio phage vB_VpS_CC6]WGL39740.1 putative tail assembly protein [Vibrio phage PG288]AFE86373.1 putative tail assembly protein [Vibrio phage SSP002]
MSYTDKEDSLYDGRPVTVYHFNYGNEDYWYTSSDEDILSPGGTATSIHIKHGTMKETTEDKRSTVKIEIDANVPLSKALRINPADSVCRVNILRGHRNDTDRQWVYYWRGTVSVVGREEASQLSLECTHMLATLASGGLRSRFSYTCPHALYGPSCRATRSADKLRTATVTAISGAKVSLSGWSTTTWWNGGQMTFVNNKYRRYIMSSDATGILLDAVPIGLAVGMEVSLVAGCDRTKATCQSKFNNLANYGGYLAVPTKNPFQDGIA